MDGILWAIPSMLAAAIVFLHFSLQGRKRSGRWSPKRAAVPEDRPRRVIRPEFRFDAPPARTEPSCVIVTRNRVGGQTLEEVL